MGFIFAAALFLRCAVAVPPALNTPDLALLASDGREYTALAYNVVHHGVYSVFESPPYPLEHKRPPGYVLLLMPFTAAAGLRPTLWVVMIQAVLGALTCVLAAKLAGRLIGSELGRWAGLAVAAAPMGAVMAGFFYSEVWFSLLLTAGLYLLVAAGQDDRPGLGLDAGLLLGLAALTRTILLPALIIPVAALLLMPGARRRGLHAGLVLLGAAAICLPWMLYMQASFGRLMISSVGDTNLYYYNAASLQAHRQGIPLSEARDQLAAELQAAGGDDLRPGAAEGTLARRVISAAPAAFLWYNGLDALNGLRPGFGFLLSLYPEIGQAEAMIVPLMRLDVPALAALLPQQNVALLAVLAAMLIYTIALLSGAAVGLGRLATERAWAAILILGVLPGALLYLPGIASNARFRMPVEPLLAVAAVYGLGWLIKWLKQREKKINVK